MIAKNLICPVCGNKNTEHVFSHKSLPKYNLERFFNRESALKADKREVAFYFCPSCLFVFNAAFDDREMDYLIDYESSRSCSKQFNNYLDFVCKNLGEAFSLIGKKVVEVGCGDGQFLEKLRERYKFNGYGYDPNLNKDWAGESNKHSGGPDLHFIQEYYNPAYNDVPDVLILRHTLEHQKNPNLFLSKIVLQPKPGSSANIYIEVPALEWIIDNNWILAFQYEHCSYYSQFSIEKVMNLCGYTAKKVLFGFGNEYLQYYGTNDGLLKEIQPSIKGNEALRQSLAARVSQFGKRTPHILECLKTYVAPFLVGSVLWGASGKGTSLVNLLDIDYNQIAYVVDSNEKRHGTYIPATGQLVVAPKFLKKLKPKFILLTNSDYRAEIQSQLSGLGLQPELIEIDKFIKKI